MRVSTVHHLHSVLVEALKVTLILSIALLAASSFVVTRTLASQEQTPTTELNPNSTRLEVNGFGQEAPASSSSTLQGAGSVPQSGNQAEGLQNNGSGLQSLQPNAGQSKF